MAKETTEPKPTPSPEKVKPASPRAGRKVRTYPITPFEESYEFAKTIYKLGSGEKVRRLTLFEHLQKSPDSGTSRMMITNSSKYGLTVGGYQADFLGLSDKAKIAVSDEQSPVLSLKAKFELAIGDVDVFKFFFEKFTNNKLPASIVLKDLLKENFQDKDIDDNDANAVVDIFIVNIKYLGLLQTIAGAERIISLEHGLEKLPTVKHAALNSGNSTIDLVQTVNTDLSIPTFAPIDNICFYVTPIGDEGSEQRQHSDLFLEHIIRPAVEQFGLKVIRADGIDKPGTITNQIIEYLFKSKLVVADLSFHNPNVFYELALRHVSRLPTVQIVRKGDKIPFDISQFRTIVIDNTGIYSLIPKLETYKAEIASQVRQALNNEEPADNPVANVFPKIQVILNEGK